jgi:nitrous oxidase accessory protein NosD
MLALHRRAFIASLFRDVVGERAYMKPTLSVPIGSFLSSVLLAASAVAAEWTVGIEFPTIQGTVNAAASSDTIHIPTGDYYEQVVIVDKNLMLAGEPGAILHATSSMTPSLRPHDPNANSYSIVGMLRSTVVMTGLTFEGERLGNSYNNAFYGIVFRGSGGRMENCTVRGFRGLTQAGARGISVANFVGLGTPAIDLNVLNSTFADNERSIVLAGDEINPAVLRTTFTIEGTMFTGLGPTSIVHNAILIVTGAGGLMKANRMSGYSYNGGANAFSSAVFAHDGQFSTRGYLSLQPIRYEGNVFADNDHHVVTVTANDSQIVSNRFQQTGLGWRRWGSVVLSGTNVLVADNQFSDLPVGIELFGGEINGTDVLARRGIASGTKLSTNRFCRVHQPIRAQPLAIGTQESGTEITCPLPAARDLHVPADFATIQQAVEAAAPGDTIQIAPGDYFEQIVIGNKGRLTLVGAPGAVIHASPLMSQTMLPFGGWSWFPVLGIYRSDVVVSNLTFDGELLGQTRSNLYGIYFLGSGGRVENCTLREFRGADPSSATYANAVYTDNSVAIGSPSIRLDLVNNVFSENQVSIHLRGDPMFNPTLHRTSFTLEGNTVTGLGAVPLAVDGIIIRNGAAGEVRNNTIRDHTYTRTGDDFSSGISAYDGRASVRSNFAPLLSVRYEGNTFSNNDEHLVLVAANDSQIVNNIFHGRGPDQPRWGALAISGTNVLVANNDFSSLDTAILLFGDDHFFSGWPAIPTAMSVNLSGNWFCNVAESLRVQSFDTVFQDQGTQLCPFRPVFQSISSDNGTLKVRAWHGQPITIEAAVGLGIWTPIHTRTPTLPTFDYREPTAPDLPHRFYRAFQQ